MLKKFIWTAPAVALLGLVTAMSSVGARAADVAPAATSSVVVSIVDAKGAAVPNGFVQIYKQGEEPKGGAGHTKKKHADVASSQPAAAPTTAPVPFATATTGADGKVTISMPTGQYVAIVHEKGTGRGKQPLTVNAGDNNAVTITLAAGKGGAAAAGGAKGGKHHGKKGGAAAGL